MPSEEERYIDYLNYLMEKYGFSQEVASAIAEQMAPIDITGWQPEDVVLTLDTVGLQAQQGITEREPNWLQNAVAWLGELSRNQEGLFAPSSPQQLQVEVELPQGELPPPDEKEGLVQWLVNSSREPLTLEQAKRYASILTSYDYTGMSNKERAAYTEKWLPQQIRYEQATGFDQKPREERVGLVSRQIQQAQIAAGQPAQRNIPSSTEEAVAQLQATERERQAREFSSRRADVQNVRAVGQEQDARARTAAYMQQGRESDWQKFLGTRPSMGSVSEPIIEGLRGDVSPAASRYFQRNLPSIAAGAGIPEAREEWWRSASELPKGGSVIGWANAARAKREGIATSDPWAAFLEGYPFSERFQALSPQERGFRSSQFRPRTRRLG